MGIVAPDLRKRSGPRRAGGLPPRRGPSRQDQGAPFLLQYSIYYLIEALKGRWRGSGPRPPAPPDSPLEQNSLPQVGSAYAATQGPRAAIDMPPCSAYTQAMIRTQVQLADAQVRKLRRIAKQQGVSVAELVRRCIERGIDDLPGSPDRYARASRLIGKFRDRYGKKDVSEAHDVYLDEVFD